MIRFLRQVAGSVARSVGLRPAHAPIVGNEKGAAFYDTLYSSAADYQVAYERSHYYFLWSVIADRLRRDKVRRVLEIGCGAGQLAAYLLDQGITHYAALDFSPTAIELARKNAPAGDFLVGDARDPAIHTRVEHEVVLCTEVLEHIHDDLLVVSAFTPGKRCLCTVPNFPYESHVRHFKDADEVKAHYGAFFESLDVMTFRSPRCTEDRFFLMDGIRNGHRA